MNPRRSRAALAGLLLTVPLAACGSDGEAGEPEPSPTETSEATTDEATQEPTEEPTEESTEEPTESVEPATGPEVSLIGGVTVRAPEGVTWSELATETETLQSVANGEGYTVTANVFPGAGFSGDLPEREQLDSFVKGTGTVHDDVDVDGIGMAHVSGEVKAAVGGFGEFYRSPALDGFSYTLLFNFEEGQDEQERAAIIGPVLASIGWGGLTP